MKTFATLSTLALALALAPLDATASGLVPVTFSLSAGSHVLPDVKTCEVLVPAGADGADVLDAAAAQGCISGWVAGFGGAYASCIDGVCEQTGTFWAFYVDEALPCGGSCGILDVAFVGGENAEFSYVDWFTPFTLPL